VSSWHCPRQTRTCLTLTTLVMFFISRLTLRRKHTDPVKNVSLCHFIYCFSQWSPFIKCLVYNQQRIVTRNRMTENSISH
jgi:hypothetical protein